MNFEMYPPDAPTGPVCPINNVAFPRLMTGVYQSKDELDDDEDLNAVALEIASSDTFKPFGQTPIALDTLKKTICGLSFIIHHHSTHAEMEAFRSGRDLDNPVDDFDWNNTLSDHDVTTEHGIFSLDAIRTHPSWPGPMLIYVADGWSLAVAPDGSTMTYGDLINMKNDFEIELGDDVSVLSSILRRLEVKLLTIGKKDGLDVDMIDELANKLLVDYTSQTDL